MRKMLKCNNIKYIRIELKLFKVDVLLYRI